MITLNNDLDIKIAGDRPSEDIKKNQKKEVNLEYTATDVQNAKKLGKEIARLFIDDATSAEKNDANGNLEMMLQRRLLLSFTATVGFESYCKDDALGGIAQKSFIDAVKRENAQLYSSSSDTGAFSFYYLAFRRGGDIERRIGQTFAMLCSHDGDPIFQELGEALYCWFSAEIEKAANALKLNKN